MVCSVNDSLLSVCALQKHRAGLPGGCETQFTALVGVPTPFNLDHGNVFAGYSWRYSFHKIHITPRVSQHSRKKHACLCFLPGLYFPRQQTHYRVYATETEAEFVIQAVSSVISWHLEQKLLAFFRRQFLTLLLCEMSPSPRLLFFKSNMMSSSSRVLHIWRQKETSALSLHNLDNVFVAF